MQGPASGAVPTTAAATSGAGVEHHSIDWVPHHERRGTVSHLGTLWFVGNINLTAIATGVTVYSIGAGLMWTVIATVAGSLFGTFFMAFHSAQGPQLGLPQLVQSRPQFGYVGAALSVFVFALVNYVAYNTSDAILSGDAMHAMFNVDARLGYFMAASTAALIALYGYHWIHRVNRWLTVPILVVMIALTIAAVRDPVLPVDAFALGQFRAGPVMTVFVLVSGFQLGWAPYVSDYSRYLPADVGVRGTFWWTYLPSALSAIWVFILGAIVSATGNAQLSTVESIVGTGNRLMPGLGWVATFVLLLGLVSVMALNVYGGMMAMISIRDSISPIRAGRSIRALCIGVFFVVVTICAQVVGVERFTMFYANVLIFITYLFTPWTAINLVDYFFVRRGVYVLREIFRMDGIYGRWGWRGNVAYIVTLLAMVPFMVTDPYTGAIAARIGRVDLSMFVGLPLAGALYWWFCRSLDVEAERRMAAEE